MRLTKENVKTLPIPQTDISILQILLEDLEEINKIGLKELYINWQDYHDDCSSSECPDYYGYYTIRYSTEILGFEMVLDELDRTLCLLYEYVLIN